MSPTLEIIIAHLNIFRSDTWNFRSSTRTTSHPNEPHEVSGTMPQHRTSSTKCPNKIRAKPRTSSTKFPNKIPNQFDKFPEQNLKNLNQIGQFPELSQHFLALFQETYRNYSGVIPEQSYPYILNWICISVPQVTKSSWGISVSVQHADSIISSTYWEERAKLAFNQWFGSTWCPTMRAENRVPTQFGQSNSMNFPWPFHNFPWLLWIQFKLYAPTSETHLLQSD